MKVTLIGLCLLFAGAGQAGPLVSVIIDDLGNRGALDRRAVALPGPVAMAVLPHTPHAVHVAERAHRAGKEVLVHLPMQSQGALDPPRETIALHDNRGQVEAHLAHALEGVPHAVGINNHRGSLITRHPGHMGWLMAALARRPGLMFVDSRTTPLTVAERVAREHGIPALARDVFLDDDPSRAAVEQAFDRLVATARRSGHAVAIGHPRPATLAVLEARLPQLERLGITLVPLSDLLESEEPPIDPVTDRVAASEPRRQIGGRRAESIPPTASRPNQFGPEAGPDNVAKGPLRRNPKGRGLARAWPPSRPR